MKYVFLVYGDAEAEAALSGEERRAIGEEHIRLHASLGERGALVLGEPVAGGDEAFSVRRGEDGRRIIEDGPLVATDVQLGSVYVVECEDAEEARVIASQVPASPGLAVAAWRIAEM